MTQRATFSVSVGLALAFVLAAGCTAPAENGSNNGLGGPVAGYGTAGQPFAGVSGGGNPAILPTAGVGGAAGMQAVIGTDQAMPCEVETAVRAKCGSCHGATKIGGAPMSLVTWADFQHDYAVVTTPQLAGRTMKMYELARIRVNREMGTAVMPQGTPLSDVELSTLSTWLTNGAPAGTACAVTAGAGGTGATNEMMGGSGAVGMTGGTGGPVMEGYRARNECEGAPDAYLPLEELEGETCYEFLTHNVSSATDTTKFSVPTGESYNQFYYAIPWPTGTVATRFGARFDNLEVLHHWLGFTSTSLNAHGTVVRNVLGTTLGESSELVGGWAVGGCNTVFPAEMGLKLPNTGRIMIQWHHYNNTGRAALDGSAVQWCTVPENARPNVGGLTFLGTENFNGLAGMPAGRESDFGGTCLNDSNAPITIVGFSPHMHLLGVHMKSVIQRSSGMMETVFDEPFIFDQQVNYIMEPSIVLAPGERITSTCTFNNTTNASVAFGQSTRQEMCYQFAIAYPHAALNNGVLSLIGATNTCW